MTNNTDIIDNHPIDEFETEDEVSPIEDNDYNETQFEMNTITNRRSSLTDYPNTSLGLAFEPGNPPTITSTTTYSPPHIIRSPIKSPNSASKSLPPIPPGSLKISKRRKLEPVSSSPYRKSIADNDDNNPIVTTALTDHPTITPIKQRSFSSPLKSVGRRTPSLQDRPIPVLSPPSIYEEDTTPASDKLLIVEAAGEPMQSFADTPSSNSSESFTRSYGSSPPTVRNRSVTTPAILMKTTNSSAANNIPSHDETNL